MIYKSDKIISLNLLNVKGIETYSDFADGGVKYNLIITKSSSGRTVETIYRYDTIKECEEEKEQIEIAIAMKNKSNKTTIEFLNERQI